MKNDRTPLETALALLAGGLWPVPIKPGSKAPIGENWGAERPTMASLRATYDTHPGAGVGIRLGPEAGVIDIEVDGPQGEASLRKILCGDPSTLGWLSRRGPHHLFRYDPRLARYGKSVIKAPELPGLELRIGGDGKQMQSNCPPTVGDDGNSREWNDCDVISELPESVFVHLDEYLNRPREPAAAPQGSFTTTAGSGDALGAYAAAAVERECQAVATATEGERNTTLNDAAFRLGTLVGAGALDEQTAVPNLKAAARQCGLPEREAHNTIWSGIKAGKGQPRDVSGVGARSRSSGSAPSRDGQAASGPAPWPPLRFQEPPPLLPFPVEVFPPRLQRFCWEVAQAKLAPLDFVGASMLAVAGAAIGQSFNIRIKRDWTEAPLLFVVLVALPGKTKSPVVRAVVKPLTEIDRRLREESAKAREAWTERKRAHDKDDTAPPPGPEPPQRRAIVKDITRESLVIILKDNPRGVLCDPDEASGWVASFNEYKGKGGSDRQFWLSIHGSAPISVDRKGGRAPLYVPFPFASVLGGCPPDVVAMLKDERGRNDGFLDRILFARPEEFPRQHWTEAELSEEAERDWAQAIGKLFDVAMQVQDDVEHPHLAGFTPAAKRRWVEWFNAHADEMEAPDFSDGQAGAWSKMRAHAARFALILRRLLWACEPTPSEESSLSAMIDLSDVEGAIKLASCFKSHLLRVIHQMNGGIDNAEVRAVVNWIRRKALTSFREAEVAADLRRFRSRPRLLEAVLKSLEDSGVLRKRLEARDPSQPGPKPTPTYDVHPELLSAPEITPIPKNRPCDPAAEAIDGNPGNSGRALEGHQAESRADSSAPPARDDPTGSAAIEEGDL